MTTAIMPHIIFVGEKWADSNPSFGISGSEHSFWKALDRYKEGTYEIIHFDEFFQENNQTADKFLLERCAETNPAFVFITWMFLPEEHLNPTLETLFTIETKMNIPVATWWGDSHLDSVFQLAEMLAPFTTKTVVADSATNHIGKTKHPSRFFSFPIPTDSSIFFDAGNVRDIPVSFLGSISHDGRNEFIENIRAAGIEIFNQGGQREAKLTVEQYASYLQRSAISLNILKKPFNAVNGRVFETTLSGALLLEPEWSEASHWFEPYAEFVPYSDVDDAIDKIRYYQNNDAERIRIAKSGHDKAHLLYTSDGYWSRISEEIKAFERDSAALSAYAEIQINKENYSQAIEILLDAENIDPNNFENKIRLSECYIRCDKQGDALSYIQQAKELSLDELIKNAHLARIESLAGNVEATLEYAKRALHYLGIDKTGFPCRLVGEALIRIGSIEDGVTVFLHALSSENQPATYMRLIKLLIETNLIQFVPGLIPNYLASEQIDPFVHLYLGSLMHKEGILNNSDFEQWLSIGHAMIGEQELKRRILLAKFQGELRFASSAIKSYLLLNPQSSVSRDLELIQTEIRLAS
ncbi:MAG: glycosyltransferase [Deltaproteobacteria bacterium]|nr:glycosyltransferase [Deltaproteobacteria bacterium]